MPPANTPLLDALERLKPPDHLCSIDVPRCFLGRGGPDDHQQARQGHCRQPRFPESQWKDTASFTPFWGANGGHYTTKPQSTQKGVEHAGAANHAGRRNSDGKK